MGALSALLMCENALADAPQFAPIFDAQMVLPRNVPINVWGTATGKGNVVIQFGAAKATTTPKNGTWAVVLPAQKGTSDGAELSATQGIESTVLADVVVGEVWLAAGQSNMLWRLNQTPTWGGEQGAANSDIRFLNFQPTINNDAKPVSAENMKKFKPETFYAGSWATFSGQSCGAWSGVAYYFAKELQARLKVPVGIVHASYGGSEMAAWLSPLAVAKTPGFTSLKGKNWIDSPLIAGWVRGRIKQNVGALMSGNQPVWHPFKPMFLYEAGIQKLVPFSFSGVVWYQGESDAEASDTKQNELLMTTLINSWRHEFKKPNLPWIMVQLPRIKDPGPIRAHWAEFRYVQDKVATTLQNVWSVPTIDLGSTNSDVHPKDKAPVGERMGRVATQYIYKMPAQAGFPTVKSVAKDAKGLRLELENAEGLKTTDGQPPRHFELAGADKKFHPAVAEIVDQGAIVLTSAEVKAPVYARYAWATFVEPNVVNDNALPMRPFTQLPPAGK